MTTDDLRAALAENGGRLLGFLLNRVDEVDDAPDLLGEVYLVAWRRRRDLPPDPDGARMWLFGVARKVLANHRRGSRRRAALDARLRDEVSAAIDVDLTTGVEVRAAVRSLPEPLAELIRLVHWDGFTLEEASRLLGIPASTARSRYSRARDLLQVSLGGAARVGRQGTSSPPERVTKRRESA